MKLNPLHVQWQKNLLDLLTIGGVWRIPNGHALIKKIASDAVFIEETGTNSQMLKNVVEHIEAAGYKVVNRKVATMPKRGINPVTIKPSRPGDKFAVTIGRLHVGMTLPLDKFITVVVWDHSLDPATAMLSAQSAVIDEDQFIDALGHLFPNGELKDAHETKP